MHPSPSMAGVGGGGLPARSALTGAVGARRIEPPIPNPFPSGGRDRCQNPLATIGAGALFSLRAERLLSALT